MDDAISVFCLKIFHTRLEFSGLSESWGRAITSAFSKRMKTSRTNSVPTDVELEAASKSMAARIRSEESIKGRIASYCRPSKIYHDAYVWLPDGKCHVDLFVREDAQIAGKEAQSMRTEIIEMLTPISESEREITVELDSHERILREFNGNYFNRFR